LCVAASYAHAQPWLNPQPSFHSQSLLTPADSRAKSAAESGAKTGAEISEDPAQTRFFSPAVIEDPLHPYVDELPLDVSVDRFLASQHTGTADSMGPGVFASRVGVINTNAGRPAPIVARGGVLGIAGTHTVAAQAEFGFAGVAPLQPYLYLDYNVTQHLGAYNRQWSFSFPGAESATYFEGALRLALNVQQTHYLGAGWRGAWYADQSWDELRGRPVTHDRDFSVINQRVGTWFVQYDWKEPGAFSRLRFENGNDLGLFGGDDGDAFRTAHSRLTYLRHTGSFQYRIGGVLELFVGETDYSNTVVTADGEFLVTDGLRFSDKSQGFLGLNLGWSWLHRINRLLYGELGVTLLVGLDSENIRDVFQNQWTHIPQNIPQVPLIDRDDRIRFDARLFYILHYGA